MSIEPLFNRNYQVIRISILVKYFAISPKFNQLHACRKNSHEIGFDTEFLDRQNDFFIAIWLSFL